MCQKGFLKTLLVKRIQTGVNQPESQRLAPVLVLIQGGPKKKYQHHSPARQASIASSVYRSLRLLSDEAPGIKEFFFSFILDKAIVPTDSAEDLRCSSLLETSVLRDLAFCHNLCSMILASGRLKKRSARKNSQKQVNQQDSFSSNKT